jgi:general secretion pathway protein C
MLLSFGRIRFNDNRRMPTISYDRWWAHGLTLLVWALAAASVVFWALKFVPGPSAPSAQPLPDAGAAADPQAVARLLGANLRGPATASAGASRYTLLGVVADRDHQGAALIAVDGQPPKPYLVGAKVDGDLLLQSVAPRRALLGPGADAPASVTLDLPEPTDADTAPAAPAAAPAVPALAPPATAPAGSGIPPEQFIGQSPAGAALSIHQRQDAHRPEAGR